MTTLVTDGAGIAGSNVVLDLLAQPDEPAINLDKLISAGNLENLANLDDDARHIFVHGDIGDGALMAHLLSKHQPRAILNFAAEAHVERSIQGPEELSRPILSAPSACWKRCALIGRHLSRRLHNRSAYLRVSPMRCELLSAKIKRQMWAPEGFSHGVLALSENASFLYQTTEYERSRPWNGSVPGIDWHYEGEPRLAAKEVAAKQPVDAEILP